jgi:hypothetical protein
LFIPAPQGWLKVAPPDVDHPGGITPKSKSNCCPDEVIEAELVTSTESPGQIMVSEGATLTLHTCALPANGKAKAVNIGKIYFLITT